MDDKDFDASKILENDSDIQKNRNAVPYKAILDFNAKVVQVARNKIAGVNFSNITADHVKDKLFPYLIVNTYENGSETTKAMLDKLPESTLQSIADGIVGIDTSQGLKESILSEIENLVLPEQQRSTEVFTSEMKEAVEETIDVSKYREESPDLGIDSVQEYKNAIDPNNPDEFLDDPVTGTKRLYKGELLSRSELAIELDKEQLADIETIEAQKDEPDFDDDSDIPNDVLMGSFNKLGLKPEEIQSAIDAQDAQFESQNLRDPNLTKDITEDTVDETNPCGIDVSTIDKDMGEF
jgi:hypothetical protein